MPAHFFSSGRFAALARRAVDESSTFSPSAYAAIVFAVLWVEAFCNELLHLSAIARDAELTESIRRLRQLADAVDVGERDTNLDFKIQIVVLGLSGSAIDRGAQPYQDFHLLAQLRNHLVHHHPETLKESDERDDEDVLRRPKGFERHIQGLVTRKIIPRPKEGVLRELVARLPNQHWKGKVLMPYSVFPELAAAVRAT